MATAESGVMIARRTGLALGLAAASASVLVGMAHADGTKDTVKLTVLYGAPNDPAAFESHYAQTHMPMIYAVQGIRVELAKPLPSPDGKPPAYYRITEIWFQSPEALKTALGSPEWKKISADVPNFASGGSTVLVSPLE